MKRRDWYVATERVFTQCVLNMPRSRAVPGNQQGFDPTQSFGTGTRPARRRCFVGPVIAYDESMSSQRSARNGRALLARRLFQVLVSRKVADECALTPSSVCLPTWGVRHKYGIGM